MKSVATLAITLFLSLFGFLHPLQQSIADSNFEATGETVASGQSHVCAIDVYGSARCWGLNNSGQANPPGDLGPISQISTGTMNTCAIKLDKDVVCWGNNQFGISSVPSDLTNVTKISGGAWNTCAVHTQGKVTCWGDNSYGQLQIPASLGKIWEVKVGNAHICALDDSGKVTCWGRNDWGQTDVPDDLGRVVQIALGSIHSCALSDSGKVSCWGYQSYGPMIPNGLGVIKRISAGYAHTCAINQQGSVICWGFNPYGATTVPIDLEAAREVIAAGYHTCIVSELGRLRCWGWNQDGQTSVPQDIGQVLKSKSRTIIAATPKLTGLPVLGAQVIASTDGWEAGVSFSYQWLRDGVPISAHNLSTYTIQQSDYLSKLRVIVSGSKEGYITETKTSDAVVPVNAKEKIALLQFSGSALAGSKISVNPSPRNSKFDYSFQWYRNGVAILGSNSRILLLGASDVGSSLSVRVCALYLKDVTNCLTQDLGTEVKLGFLKDVKASIYGFSKVGRQLRASVVNPNSEASVDYQWLRNSEPIPGATTNTYFVEPSDKGSSINLRVTVRKPGYATIIKTSTTKQIN